jgi:hypothetical protein
VSEGFLRILERLVEPEVGRRYQSAPEVLADLDRLDRGEEVPEGPAPAPASVRPEDGSVVDQLAARGGDRFFLTRWLLDRDRRRIARKSEPGGGPSGAPPDDRWIVRHATWTTREALNATGRACFLATVCLGILLLALLDRGTWLPWRLPLLLAAVAGIPLVVAGLIHLFDRARAIAREKAFVQALPFDGQSCLDLLREAPWHLRRGHYVSHRAALIVTFAKRPPRDDVLESHCLRVRGARFTSSDRAGRTRRIEYAGDTVMLEPWPWCRKVIQRVLVPLAGQHPISTVRIELDRSVDKHVRS